MPARRAASGAGARRAGAVAVWLLVGLALTQVAACGGGDGCAGFISVNVDAETCRELAEQNGCSGVDVTTGSCGLFGCATCGDLSEAEGGG